MPPASSSFLTPSGFFNGMLAVSEPGALNYYIFFRPIPLTLSVSRNLILTHLPLSGSLDYVLCNLIAPILFRDAMHCSSGVIIFIRQGLSFSELSTSSLCLTPTLIMYGSTSLLTTSLSFFLMFTLPLFALL